MSLSPSSPGSSGAGLGRARPVEEIRLGAIRAAIWRNETDGGIRHNVTFERLYRDGDQWKSTHSFGRDDLLVVAKVADQAHTWIHQQGREGATTNPQGQAAPEATPAGTETPPPGPTANTAGTRSRRTGAGDASLSRARLPAAPTGV